MNNEINVRRLLYYKKILPVASQRSITISSHCLSQPNISHNLQDQSTIGLPRINLRYGSVHEIKPQKQQPNIYQYFKNFVNSSKQNIQQLRDQSNQIRQEMQNIQYYHEQQFDELQQHILDAIIKNQQLIKEDRLTTTMEQFRLKKEVVKLMKIKSQLEEQIKQSQDRLEQLEELQECMKIHLK